MWLLFLSEALSGIRVGKPGLCRHSEAGLRICILSRIFLLNPLPAEGLSALPHTAGGKKAGKRLYKHYDVDHERLFEVCETLKGDFLITYDNSEEVKTMARRHGFQMCLIPMSNTHHATMEELVIGRDLSWMDRFPAVHEPDAEYGNSSAP